ncbi:hypothetical protein [Chryseobacterium sp. JK1]|uniref:hypothetical protein n=1 Tax=Chryseobacterium sp. JK1 TaxID=874294 RepID=UPI003D695E8C
MKRILNVFFFFILCIAPLSCSTNYYTVLLSEEAKIYNATDSSNVVTIIPKNTEIFLSSNSNKNSYKRVKWGNYSGWLYNPVYTSYSNYTSLSKSASPASTSQYKPSNSFSGGSVSVKGYYRKNGTYVKPHTRSAPSRRR